MLAYPDTEFTQRRHFYDQFSKLKFRGFWRKVWGQLSGSRSDLLHLGKMEADLGIRERYDAGIQTVVINQIVGSESRTRDFDRNFRPLNRHNHERWLGIALAVDKGIPLPLIELIQVGSFYFVRDGHHRLSVARLFGQKEMEAIVTIWETEFGLGDALTATPRRDYFLHVVGRMKEQLRRILDGFNRPGGGFATGAGTPALLGS